MADNDGIPTQNEDLDDAYCVTLTDEDGRDVTFELLDIISFGGKDYCMLLSVAEPQEGVVTLEVVHVSDDEDEYRTVDDPQTVKTVFGIFKERHRDEFDFKD